MSKLVIFRGDAVEHEIHLAGHTVRIGRDNRNEIVLDDKSVSRFHAEVRADADRYFIVDLKSRNGVWVNGQQIKGKAALALGVPVTLGAYELALEDDVSTGPFGDEAPPLSQHTVVSSASADQPDRPSRSATQRWSTQSPATTAKRSALFWSGLVLTTLLLCGGTYVGVRYMARPPADPDQAALNPPPAPPDPQPQSQPPAVDPTREAIDRHLADARAAMESNDNAAAALRDHVLPVLELDPGNPEALELKRRAEAVVAAAPLPKPRVPKPEVPVEVETPGISRRAGEAWPDYTSRVQRIQVNFQEGNRSLERQDFALAIARFQLVDRDEKGYRGVDSLITDTAARQRQSVEEAIDYGRRNEQAGKPSDALRWYQQAMRFDSNTTIARDRIAALTERLTKDGLEAFNRAEVFRKRNDIRAIEFYKQAADLLPASHEKNREALEWLEKLKP